MIMWEGLSLSDHKVMTQARTCQQTRDEQGVVARLAEPQGRTSRLAALVLITRRDRSQLTLSFQGAFSPTKDGHSMSLPV